MEMRQFVIPFTMETAPMRYTDRPFYNHNFLSYKIIELGYLQSRFGFVTLLEVLDQIGITNIPETILESSRKDKILGWRLDLKNWIDVNIFHTLEDNNIDYYVIINCYEYDLS